MFAGLAQPKSRGRIRLQDGGVLSAPRIELNTLTHPDDLKAALACVELCRDLGNTRAFAPLVTREAMPGPLKDDEMERYVRDAAVTYWHQTCSARHGKPRSPADLLAHRCIRVRLPKGGVYKWQFERDGQPLEVDVQGPLTLDDPGLVQTALLDGAGLGFMIEPDVREDIAAGRLIRVLHDWTPPRLVVSLYYPSRRNQSAALKAFVAAARALTHG